MKDDAAAEATAGSVRRSNVAATSAGVSVFPLWKRTPWRIVKVHTEPFRLGAHRVASTGRRTEAALEKTSCSPGMSVTPSPPRSATLTGSSEPVGLVITTRRVPPTLVAERAAWATSGFRPKAAARPARVGSERPIMAPCRRKVWRSICPVASSSMSSFSCSVACVSRNSSSRRWVSLSIASPLGRARRSPASLHRLRGSERRATPAGWSF